MQPFVTALEYREPIGIFTALAHMPYALLFDSADRAHPDARYSFIASHPIETIEAKNGQITLTNWDEQTQQSGDPFAVLQTRLRHWRDTVETAKDLPPFQGGAAGLFGYDLGRSIEILPQIAANNPAMPDMAVGIYDSVIAFDHAKNQSWIITHAPDEAIAKRKQDYLLDIVSDAQEPPEFTGTLLDWHAETTPEHYCSKVQKVIDYIHEGDIFQANLSQRFTAQTPDIFDPYAHYLHLRKINAAPFACYMNLGDIQIASSSPERFLKIKNRRVETKPIKGTRPRKAAPADDMQERDTLENSEKDRAENTMIVDLLRNDLSKCCEINSIEVLQLCALESFASVHHLVSTITGTLRPDKTPIDLLKACFPGGSITGAPKIRAQEIIEDLEPNRRGPYCGSMAYIGFDGAVDSNILIRTLVFEDGQVTLNSGGGITAQSNPESEYDETLTKAKALFESFKPPPTRSKKFQCS
ncbi:MAG: aminodeoxychorismate synthase component I [Bdellovibrionales bacterium]